MFEWNSSYATTVASIDAQHKNLFVIGGELHQAMKTGQGKAVVGKILDRLVQYATVHFTHEEQLMLQYHYPNYLKHKTEHDALSKQILTFQQEFQSGKALVTIELLQFIQNWLEKHINGTDKAYVPLMKEKSVA